MRQSDCNIRKFYVAFGTNGAGLFTAYNKAEHACKYLKKLHIKKFDSFDEAEEFAIHVLNEIAPLDVTIPETFRINHIAFVSHLMNQC